MKTDICTLTNDKSAFEAIFAEAEKSAQYNGLDKKQTLQLRLLAEELAGMLPELLEVGNGEFWIENNGKDFELHASIKAERLSSFDKENILSVSKSGKNAAAKGIVNKIKLVAEGMLEGYFTAVELTGGVDYYDFYGMGAGMYISPNQTGQPVWTDTWSLNSYADRAGADRSTEEWDELEKSIIANLADDVIVGVIGKKVDVIIKKTFA